MKIYRVDLNFSLDQYNAPKNYVALEFNQPYNVNHIRVKGFENSNFGLSKLLKNQLIKTSGVDHSFFGQSKVARRGVTLYVKGIAHTSKPSVEKVSWRQFILQLPTESITLQTSVKRVRVPGGYNPPNKRNINLNWSTSEPYIPPKNPINLNFGHLGYGHIYASVGLTEAFGTPTVSKNLVIHANGFNAQSFGLARIYRNNAFIYPIGYQSTVFGQPVFKKNTAYIAPSSFIDTRFSTSKVYNLKQILVLNGFYATLFGQPFLWGGVKNVELGGINQSIVSNPTVINTTANQEIRTSGEMHTGFGALNVSPRTIFPYGVFGANIGIANVQFPPRPKGFEATSYGTPWVSRSPRLYTALGFESFISGYAKVFDPTQKIGVTGVNTVIAGGVFGDIRVRNARRFINSVGFNAHEAGNWSNIYSNRRELIVSGNKHSQFGEGVIRNKTPSFTPVSVDHMTFGQTHIAYAIRKLMVSGFSLNRFGNAVFTKTPSFAPIGIDAPYIPSPIIGDAVRYLYQDGSSSFKSGQATIWFRYRSLKLEGFESISFGTPKLEHINRAININGFDSLDNSSYAWVSYKLRRIEVPSIQKANYASNHQVGRHQKIWPEGFVDTKFGTRIIPESKSIYPYNPPTTIFGSQKVELLKRFLRPSSFGAMVGLSGDAIGRLSIWNKRQFINQYFIADSGLVPPKQDGWLLVENKNKVLHTTGNTHTRYGYTKIDNKATQIIPVGIVAIDPSKPMISDRIRKIKPESIYAPVFSKWSVVWINASVIKPSGSHHLNFGQVKVQNTRRYYPYIGGFESSQFGKGMVSFKIRHLSFEHRYTIGPIYLPLPKVELHTNYIEPQDDDMSSYGVPDVVIHRNIITPRWTHKDFFGLETTVQNHTPELKQRGRDSNEFGTAKLRLQWERYKVDGYVASLYGKTDIAFRDRSFSVTGFSQYGVGLHILTKTGAPPYSKQYVYLNGQVNAYDEFDPEKGNGIKPPEAQVSNPSLRSNAIFAEGFVATLFGRLSAQSNGILVQPGLQELTVSEPTVTLSKRTIIPSSIESTSVVGKPRVSPWTIYAVVEAPQQARENHQPRDLHYVSSFEVFGNTIIQNKHRKIDIVHPYDDRYMARMGTPNILLRKQYVQPRGFLAQRHGVHVFGPYDLDLKVFESPFTEIFGNALIQFPRDSKAKQFISPTGIDSNQFHKPVIDYRNRVIRNTGFDSQALGYSRSPDTPYMWQSLRIGELVKGNYGGFQSLIFGQTSISLRVREVQIKGFDSYADNFEMGSFDKKMTVKLIPKPTIPVRLQAVGFVSSSHGVPNIKPAVHYIRPDGNADQYRKGAF
ncbi:hypothetical protein [Acinetobacter ursingii]|uniref:hypothetical protein n=1 Tax=Acinetobacter ursingii TaxID=108980 RepID=UPI0021CDE392|nr:hypothetical protein [Acinetobacter ursingii]MCU4350227.1 hypothetical protein [Acinetobacter ursingii]